MLIIFRKFYQTTCLIKLDCVDLHQINYITYKLALVNDDKIKQKTQNRLRRCWVTYEG